MRRIDRDLRAIGALTQAVIDGEDLEHLLGRVAREARTLVGAVSGVVVTVSGSPGMITFRAVDGRTVGPLRVGFTMPVRDTLTELALLQATNIVARNAGEIPPSGQAFAAATGIGPLIAAPLHTVGSARGVLVVGKPDTAAPFRPTDVALVSAFAAQAASAIELFELRAAETRLAVGLDRERIARDLHDGVIQALFGVGMVARAIAEETTERQVLPGLQGAIDDLDEAIAIVRGYIGGLAIASNRRRRRPVHRPPTQSRLVGGTRLIGSRSVPDVISSIGDLARTIASNGPINEVLQSLVEGAAEGVDGDFALVAAIATNGESVVIRAAAGPNIPSSRGVGDGIPTRETLVGEAMRLGRPLVYSSMEDVRVAVPDDIRRSIGPVAAIPLAVRGQSFGALLVGRRPDGEVFSRPDIVRIEAYAAQAAVALEFDRVRQELDRESVSAERDRIGRDLHGQVIQLLFRVGMAVQALQSTTHDARLRPMLRAVVEGLDRAILDLRRYVYDLGPSSMGNSRLHQELEVLAGSLVAGSNLELDVEIDPEVSTALEGSASEVLQIVREALSNVVRHARASRCSVRLGEVDGRILLEVADDGRGLKASTATMDGQRQGYGLSNIRARCTALGAEVDIRSQKGEGTRVRISIAS